MSVQAESLLTLYAGCTLLGGGVLPMFLKGPGAWTPAPPRLWLSSLCSFGLFFGLGGLLSAWLGLLPELQLFCALLAGALVGGVTTWAFRLAGSPRHDEATSNSLVGHTGQVLLSPHGGYPGQVILSAGQRAQLPARSTDLLVPGDRVLIVADGVGCSTCCAGRVKRGTEP